MSNSNGAQQGIKTNLVNVAVVLIIVCAVAFLALWVVPTLQQRAETAKEAKAAEAISAESAGKAIDKYAFNGLKMSPQEATKAGYRRELLKPSVAYERIRELRGEDRLNFLTNIAIRVPKSGAYYFYELAPTTKNGWPHSSRAIAIVYKNTPDDKWHIK